jgi:hypothetical protein
VFPFVSLRLTVSICINLATTFSEANKIFSRIAARLSIDCEVALESTLWFWRVEKSASAAVFFAAIELENNRVMIDRLNQAATQPGGEG